MPKIKRKAKTAIRRTKKTLASQSEASSSTPGTSADDGGIDTSQFLLTQLNLSDDDAKRGKELASALHNLFKKTVAGSDKEQFEAYSKGAAKYFRNKFKFFGVKAPLSRSLQKKWLETYREELTDQG